MKYKLLFILLALSCQVQAENFTTGGVRYTIISNSDKTVEVASSSQSAGSDGSTLYNGDVTIPETVSYNGRTYTVIGIGQSAFVNSAGMTSITLPSTLTYIRKEAFNVCISLVEITIPRNVTSIGYNVFSVTSISKIIVESSTPATCDYNAFQYPQDYNNCVLYVPAGSKTKYQNASEWKLFKSIIELGPEPGSLNGHEYVDLGLPSGNLWATSNYGASSPTGYGSYLEWYQCGNVASSWGESWRTPSRTEMNELVNKCTWTWTTENGVKGYRVTGANGNYIFLPAAGFKMTMGGGAQSSGEQLYYWTTTSGGDGFSYALVASSSSISTSSTYNTSLMMCSVRPCADKISSSVLATNITLSQQNITLEKGQSYTLTATISPSNATNKTVTWTTSNSSVATVSNGLVTAIDVGTAQITAKTTDGSNLSASCKVTVTDSGSGTGDVTVLRINFTDGTYRDYSISEIGSMEFVETDCPVAEAVDLGLPSGTKWASWNIGASAPEEYGGYFAWGETEENDVYDWSTYKYGRDWDDCDYIGYDIAGTEYDVAHVKWGGSWRMPSIDQINELLNNCSRIWTTQNGVRGTLVTGPNGAVIFLPATGVRNKAGLYSAGSDGYYWSSSLYPDFGGHTWYLYFDSNGWRRYSYYGRYVGQSVRAVCP